MIKRQALRSRLGRVGFPAGPGEICDQVERNAERSPAELAAALEAPARLYRSEEEALAILGQREGVRRRS